MNYNVLIGLPLILNFFMIEPIFDWKSPCLIKAIFLETYKKSKQILFIRSKTSFRKSHIKSITSLTWGDTQAINRVVKTSNRLTCPSIPPSCPSNKAYVRPLRNIQRICQLRPLANGHVRPSVTSLYDIFIPISVIYDNPGYQMDNINKVTNH
jgi:hypothetical protein